MTDNEILRILDKVVAQAMRPKGYSQSHARKIWKEQTSEHAIRALVHGWSDMKIELGKFPGLADRVTGSEQ